MKYRNGFVTNSSSSSFIISIIKGTTLEEKVIEKMLSEFFLEENLTSLFVEYPESTRNYVEEINEDNVDKVIYSEELVNKVKEELKNGHLVYRKEYSDYKTDEAKQYLDYFKDLNLIKILYEEKE